MTTDVERYGGGVTDVDGLEDVDSTDLTMPILRIAHKEGAFVNSLTNEALPEANVILLGIVKQRILWPLEPGEEGEQPMCRSYDFVTGHPNPEKWDKVALRVSGYTTERLEEGSLGCASCPMKEWESSPKDSKPWCTEQYTFPLLILEDPSADQGTPAILSVQRTGIRPARTYVSGFVQGKRPLYTAKTRIELVHQKRGSVEFSVPKFVKIGDSDPTIWSMYSEVNSRISEFLRTPRTGRPDDEVAGTASGPSEATAAPVEDPEGSAAPAKRPAPTPTPTPVEDSAEYDDDEPF
jgi:hypothetical protein